jgi:hypothetical protein
MKRDLYDRRGAAGEHIGQLAQQIRTVIAVNRDAGDIRKPEPGFLQAIIPSCRKGDRHSGARREARTRNPGFLRDTIWIPGSRAAHAPRNDRSGLMQLGISERLRRKLCPMLNSAETFLFGGSNKPPVLDHACGGVGMIGIEAHYDHRPVPSRRNRTSCRGTGTSRAARPSNSRIARRM